MMYQLMLDGLISQNKHPLGDQYRCFYEVLRLIKLLIITLSTLPTIRSEVRHP
jgi:hypothetical protein